MKQKIKLSKAAKVGIVAAAVGGAVIAVPFIIAAGPVSIVSALATLGGGALSAGGLGVAGGIIVATGGAAVSAALAAYISSKTIKDPDLLELQDNIEEIEKLVAKLQLFDEKNNNQYTKLKKRYGDLSKFINDFINDKKRVKNKNLKEYLAKSVTLIEDLEDLE